MNRHFGCACLLLLASASFGATDPALSPEIQSYSTALNKLLQEKHRQAIEPVFIKAHAACRKLLSIIESLDQPTYESIQKNLKGLILNREEVVLAEPDIKFYADLAKRKGLKLDQSFFALITKTNPDGVWPAYIEQQTDATGCTKYGDKVLVGLYGDWARFQKEFPAADTHLDRVFFATPVDPRISGNSRPWNCPGKL